MNRPKSIIVTNNPMVHQKYNQNRIMEYNENASFMDILCNVRDKIHIGHTMLTHPLSGSIKPYETPYKSILVTLETEPTLEGQSLAIIEKSIQLTQEFQKKHEQYHKSYTRDILEDFQLIDLSLMEECINKTR